jgi:hypothetical protein
MLSELKFVLICTGKILMVNCRVIHATVPAAINFADIRQEQCTRRQVIERALKQQQQAAWLMLLPCSPISQLLLKSRHRFS